MRPSFSYSLVAAVLFLACASEAHAACPRGTAYPDGCSGAPSGAPQYPNLLSNYTARPPWNVAGSDYYVGIPAGTTLTDWESNNNPNISINTSARMVRCTGAGASVTLNAIDFSLHGGAFVYISSGGCASLTITNSNFACPSAASSYAMVVNQSNAIVTVKNSKFNGLNCGSPQLSTTLSGTSIIQYNWFLNSPQQIADGVDDYRFNLLDDMKIGPAQHMNYLQWGGSTIGTVTVAYNTGYQTSAGGAEGFQFYTNASGGATLSNVSFTNNTLIARPSSGQTMSYMIHGNCHSATDCAANHDNISGSAVNANNYFDPSGAYGAYYTGSFNISGASWSSSGNTNMNTGRIINPLDNSESAGSADTPPAAPTGLTAR